MRARAGLISSAERVERRSIASYEKSMSGNSRAAATAFTRSVGSSKKLKTSATSEMALRIITLTMARPPASSRSGRIDISGASETTCACSAPSPSKAFARISFSTADACAP